MPHLQAKRRFNGKGAAATSAAVLAVSALTRSVHQHNDAATPHTRTGPCGSQARSGVTNDGQSHKVGGMASCITHGR